MTKGKIVYGNPEAFGGGVELDCITTDSKDGQPRLLAFLDTPDGIHSIHLTHDEWQRMTAAGNAMFEALGRKDEIAKPPRINRFRWHRGGLAESMATLIEWADATALKEALLREIAKWGVEKEPADVTARIYSERGDPRIGWEQVYIVMLEGWGPLGFSDAPLDSEGAK